MRSLATWCLLAALGPLGACRHPPKSDAAPPEPRACVPKPSAATWRHQRAWTQLRAVAIDRKGRVAVVGHRLVAPAKPDALPRSVGLVAVHEVDGRIAWERMIDRGWTEGVAIATTSHDEVIALLRGEDGGVDRSVVVRLGADGEPRWQRAVDLGPQERPLALAVGPDGSVSWTAMLGDGATSDEPRSWIVTLTRNGDERWRRELESAQGGIASALAIGADGQLTVGAYDVESSWLTALGPDGQRRDDFEIDLRPTDLVLMSNESLVMVGQWDPSRSGYPEPIQRLDQDHEPRWQVGWEQLREDPPRSVVLHPTGDLYALGESQLVAVTADGRVDPKAPSGAVTPQLTDRDTLVDLAVGRDGSMAIIGRRSGRPWGRVDAWLVKLERPAASWPAATRDAPRSRDPTEPWTGQPRDDHPRANAVVRWLAPAAPWFELEPPDEARSALRRSIAVGLLRGGSLHCAPRISELGPDEDLVEPGEPGLHSTLQDPCVRLERASEWAGELEAADLELVQAELAALLLDDIEYSDSEIGVERASDVLALGFARGRGIEFAGLALDGAHLEVQRQAITALQELGTPEAVALLRDSANDGPAEISMQAIAALEALGEPLDLGRRPPGATAVVLLHRYFVLRRGPDPARAQAYWRSLLKRSGRYRLEERCVGDWPETEDEDPITGTCEERVQRRRAAPTEHLEADSPRCTDTACEIGREEFRENGPHGWYAVVHFERGRDGELYVDKVIVTRWEGSPH